jgi:hypothetical protein
MSKLVIIGAGAVGTERSFLSISYQTLLKVKL